MVDKLTESSRIYTDIQSVQNLQYENKKNPQAAKKEVAKQFEAILIQMVMQSMREANKPFASDLFGNGDMDIYQDMYDKQLSLNMSNSGLGFAAMVEKNIDQLSRGTNQNPLESLAELQTTPIEYKKPAETTPSAVTTVATNKQNPGPFSSPEAFINQLWSAAKSAADIIGLSPKVLLAQAALETNWGKNVIKRDSEKSTFNLFNIKADSSWHNPLVSVESLEEKNGILVKEKSHFRSYASYQESFLDYIQFLKENVRYNKALDTVSQPEKFIQELQKAGFATDHNYADKIQKIFSSDLFKKLTEKMAFST